MSKLRIDLIQKAFEKLDSTKDGVITVEDIERVRMSLALFSTRALHVDQLGLCVLASRLFILFHMRECLHSHYYWNTSCCSQSVYVFAMNE